MVSSSVLEARCNDGFRLLAAAVVDRAVMDYEDAMNALKRLDETGAELIRVHGEYVYRFTAMAMLADVDSFFRSRRAHAMMAFDPMVLYNKIRENYAECGECMPYKGELDLVSA